MLTRGTMCEGTSAGNVGRVQYVKEWKGKREAKTKGECHCFNKDKKFQYNLENRKCTHTHTPHSFAGVYAIICCPQHENVKTDTQPSWKNFNFTCSLTSRPSLTQEKKKVHSQVLVEQDNLFGPRPSTSSRRLSNVSSNGGFGNATPLNRRISLGIQQLGSNSINSATQGISYIKEGKKAHRQKIFLQTGVASHFREDTASVVSTYSGPFSPWISGSVYEAWLRWELRD